MVKNSKKIVSIFLCVAIIMSCLPFTLFTVGAKTGANMWADASDYDSWKEIFKSESDNISTENAGGVWTDKSVYTDNSQFSSYGIQKNEENSFMVSLSALASNISTEGEDVTSIPTDTVIILDMSTSINNYVTSLATAANESIKSLVNANPENRVCVLTFNSTVSTLLELAKYSAGTNGDFLTGNKQTISIASGVKNLDDNTTVSGSITTSRGTNIQAGVVGAVEQLINRSETSGRKPVVILLTDGAPTLANTDVVSLNGTSMPLNNNGDAGYSFVTQLTLAYMKQVKFTDMLFYTIGVGDSVDDSLMQDVLNPTDPLENTTLQGYWDTFDGLSANDSMTVGTKKSYTLNMSDALVGLDYDYVSKVKDDNGDEVNGYFVATGNNISADIQSAFEKIIEEIFAKTEQSSSILQEGDGFSGALSFSDKLGKYMVVTDIKGILMNGSLLSGADIAQSITSNSSSLDSAVISAIQSRLGLADESAVNDVVAQAILNGQISYTSSSDFSNYIGWYSNDENEYLGFCQDNVTSVPDGATMTIKSFMYLCEADSTLGISETDMLLATVDVQEDIETGDQTIIFTVPEKVMATVYYKVSLDNDGNPTDIRASGATSPMSLVYETALNPEINVYNCKEYISQEYLDANTNADGTVNFYSNLYETDGSTGYETDNTYCYYVASVNNDRYYFVEDTTIYTDTNGTAYSGSTAPDVSGTYYRQQTVYTKVGSTYSKEIVYHKLSAKELESATDATGQWVIPAGTINTEQDGYAILKETNATDTLEYSNKPFVDSDNPQTSNGVTYYVVGTTLGNNGKISYTAETGVKVSKVLSSGATYTSDEFEFVLTNTTNTSDSSTYNALKMNTDGTTEDTTVKFSSGVGKVYLKAGESIYVGGMTDGDIITVAETETNDYVVDTINGASTGKNIAATIVDKEFFDVKFSNRDRAKGSLTVSKEISHSYGSSYEIPEMEFTFEITFEGDGSTNATFGGVTTDANGKATVKLKDGEQITITDIPEGITATVVEKDVPTGFTASYIDNNTAGDGAVEIVGNATATVNVVNTYSAQKVTVGDSISISGTKSLTGREWKSSDNFTFTLEKRENSGWTLIDTQTATNNSKTFNFNVAFANEQFTSAGTYLYRVTEKQENANGIECDTTEHQFVVEIADADMDGYYEISSVSAYNSAPTVVSSSAGKWNVTTDFNNTYTITGSDSVTLSGNKTLTNHSMNDGDFTFSLYKVNSSFVADTTPYKTASNTNGKFSFELEYTSSDVGNTYYYVVKENNAGETIDGITYSNAEYKVTVTVSDNTVGGVSANVIIDGENGAVEVDELDFVNTYSVAATETQTIAGEKVLNGIRDLEANEFAFEIYEASSTFEVIGTPIETVYNDADGSFTFNAIPLNEAKTYYFTVKENSADVLGGVEYDNSEYHITVVVKDNGVGNLYVDSQTIEHYKNNTSTSTTEIKFVNTYSAESTYADISGEKVLEGRELVENEFTFLLLDENETVIDSDTNNADGTFSFSTLTFTAPNTYKYYVVEDNTSELERMTFDDTVYVVEITVTDDKEGHLIAEVPVITESETGVSADEIVFNNKYTPRPDDITVDVNINKTVNNKGTATLSPEGFKLELKDVATNEILDVTTDENGEAVITLTFTEDDIGNTYIYELTEVNDGKEYVTYSTAKYTIEISITLNSDNELVATITQNEVEVDQINAEFVNEYDYTPIIIDPNNPNGNPNDDTNGNLNGDNSNQDGDSNTGNPSIPNTSENSASMWFVVTLAVSGLAIVLDLFKRKKRNIIEG